MLPATNAEVRHLVRDDQPYILQEMWDPETHLSVTVYPLSISYV